MDDKTHQDKWEQFTASLERARNGLGRVDAVNLNSNELRGQIADVCKLFLREVRPLLVSFGLVDELTTINDAVSELLKLSGGHNKVSSFKKQMALTKREISRIGILKEINANSNSNNSSEPAGAESLISTLTELVPSAALSYRQAVRDLNDDKRLSFRGPALELREALRETLDHLAPDDAVMQSPGYQHEKDRKGPTMKQKVRFILKSRGHGRTKSAVPESSVVSVDEVVGTLTRSVYDLSSVATHVSSERKQVRQVMRYVDAVLHDILEL